MHDYHEYKYVYVQVRLALSHLGVEEPQALEAICDDKSFDNVAFTFVDIAEHRVHNQSTKYDRFHNILSQSDNDFLFFLLQDPS